MSYNLIILSTTKENLTLNNDKETSVNETYHIKAWDQHAVHKFPCQNKNFVKNCCLYKLTSNLVSQMKLG